MYMYLYTKSIAMTLCSVTAALAVALTGLAEEASTPDASSMPYPASQSQTAGMPDSGTVPGATSETAPGAASTADSAASEAPGVNYTIKCNTLGEQKEVHTEPW